MLDELISETVDYYLFEKIEIVLQKVLGFQILTMKNWDKKCPAIIDFGDRFFSIFDVENMITVDLHIDDGDHKHDVYVHGMGMFSMDRFELVQFLRNHYKK